jgi:hypothetical protein
MSFNTVGQMTTTHKAWDHVGNNLPGPTYSEGQRPGFDFQVAKWLPVQFLDKYFEDWVVIAPGKLVALDPDGYLMPAQYGIASTVSNVVYTSNDVAAGTIDIATGSAVTIAKTVVLANLTGVKDATWTAANAGTGSVTSGFMGCTSVDVAMGTGGTVRYPIGVAPQACLMHPGGDGRNPADYNNYNYNRQPGVPVLCDYVLQLPLVPGQVAEESISKTDSGTALVLGTSGTHNRTECRANDRYDTTTGFFPITATDPVIGLALDEYPICSNTIRTTVTMQSSAAADDVSSILVNEKTSISGINQAGDYWIDTQGGVIFIYSADGLTVPSVISGASGTVSVTYYHYATAAGTIGAATASRFACVVASATELRPGDFLACGSDSNWVRQGPGTAAEVAIVGQVLGFETFPGGTGLDRVKTAYNSITTDASGAMTDGALLTSSTGLGHMDQMPGTANRGVPASIHNAGAGDLLVIINMINR